MTTTLERFARWAAGVGLADVPGRVVEKARAQQASVLGATLAGLHDPAARKVIAAAVRHGGQGASRLLATGARTSRPAAVRANASASCTFDYDEILLLGHPGHSTVTVPLVLGEELGRTFGDAVVAQVAGNEIAGRLGLATFLGPQNGQMIPHLHCAGAAVAAGRLLGLDGRALAHALAIALAQPPSALWPSFLGDLEAKVLVAAHGTAMGVMAAELAAEGFTGALDLLDHPHGFFRRFAFAPLPRALGGLGRAWLSDTLQVKEHAACWYYQALLDAAASLPRLRAADVSRVRCAVTFLADAVDSTERLRPRGPLSANEVNFSIAASVALVLLRGRLRPDDLTTADLAANEAEVRALAAKIEVAHDPALDRKLFVALDGALDLPGLLGTVSTLELGRALGRARAEFPQARGLGAGSLLRSLARAPRVLAALAAGRRRDYDLGAHDLSALALPIPGAIEVELVGGRRLEAARDVEAGALSLPGATGLAFDKLRAAAAARHGGPHGTRWADALAAARPDTPIAAILG